MNQNELSIVEQLPREYRPLSPWAYFGYSILFSIPFIGFICLIVFALSGDNINRRNFARSFFCIYAVAIILAIFLAVSGASLGFLANNFY